MFVFVIALAFVFVIALVFVFVTLEEVWSGTLALYKDSKPRPQWWWPSLTPTLHTALLFTKKQLISFFKKKVRTNCSNNSHRT